MTKSGSMRPFNTCRPKRRPGTVSLSKGQALCANRGRPEMQYILVPTSSVHARLFADSAPEPSTLEFICLTSASGPWSSHHSDHALSTRSAGDSSPGQDRIDAAFRAQTRLFTREALRALWTVGRIVPRSEWRAVRPADRVTDENS